MFDLMEIIQFVIAGVLVAGVKALFNINSALSRLEGRMGQTETWQEQHEKQDDDRFHLIGERFDRMQFYLREDRERRG